MLLARQGRTVRLELRELPGQQEAQGLTEQQEQQERSGQQVRERQAQQARQVQPGQSERLAQRVAMERTVTGAQRLLA